MINYGESNVGKLTRLRDTGDWKSVSTSSLPKAGIDHVAEHRAKGIAESRREIIFIFRRNFLLLQQNLVESRPFLS